MAIIPYRARRESTPAAYNTGFDPFDRLFDNLFSNALSNLSGRMPSVTDAALRMDISETEKAYLVKAELPGVEEKDINVTLDDGMLTISGEKRQESEEEGRTFHRVERSYGSFSRSLTLPADVDEDGIRARMKDGVLEVEIARKPEAKGKARRIDVQKK
jgi:HSP20 family protein